MSDDRAEEIEQDLLRRLERAAPRDRVFIEEVARLAANVEASTLRVASADCREIDAVQHLGGFNALSQALAILGDATVDDTIARTILDAALPRYLAIERCASGAEGHA